MKNFLLCFILGLSQFAAAAVVNYEGVYECSGKELGTDERFTGTMTIKKTKDAYSINSRFAADAYHGTGIYDSSNKSLSVVFINPEYAEETGLIIFHAENQGKLKAVWTYLRQKNIAHSICKRMAA